MDTLRIAICEDEMAELDNLLRILEESQYPITTDLFHRGEDFLSQFKPFQYDLIFMDIFMDGLTGIQTIAKVREVDSQVAVAFITTSKDFALESYRLEAFKYIEKPATKKAVVEALQLAQLKQQTVERLVLRTSSNMLSYPIFQILYLEQKGRNLMVHLADGGHVSVAKKLDEVSQQLEGKNFLRCHKSFLVNLAFVRGIDRELSTFSMEQGDNVHIRRESFWTMKKAFETYLFANQQEA